MNRFVSIVIGIIITLCAFGQPVGRYADIVDLKTYVDEDFNVYYSVCIYNKTDKDITSVKYRIGFKNPYEPFDVMKTEHWEVTTQVSIPRGEKRFTEFHKLKPKQDSFIMYIAVIFAIRFSDGTMIQSRYAGDFGNFWPD